MPSSDTYHPKTVWMAQGATHLRCSSGGEILVAEGGKFKQQGNIHTTGVAQSTTLDPWGTYALDTSGVYEVNPVRGSICTIHLHTTAYIFFKGTTEVSAMRFPTSKMRCIKAAASSKDCMRWGPAFQIRGFSTGRAYVVGLGGSSNTAGSTINSRIRIVETSST